MYTALSNIFTILLFYVVAYNGIPYTYLPCNDVTPKCVFIFDYTHARTYLYRYNMTIL